MSRKITFDALCAEAKAAPTKLDDLIARAAAVTRKSIPTIKMWAIGRQVPDDLSIDVLANDLNLDFDCLKEGFIAKNNEWKSNRIKKGLTI